jgi:hypothetical protein
MRLAKKSGSLRLRAMRTKSPKRFPSNEVSKANSVQIASSTHFIESACVVTLGIDKIHVQIYLLLEKNTNYFPTIEFHIIMWNKIVFDYLSNRQTVRAQSTVIMTVTIIHDGISQKYGAHTITQIPFKYRK